MKDTSPNEKNLQSRHRSNRRIILYFSAVFLVLLFYLILPVVNDLFFYPDRVAEKQAIDFPFRKIFNPDKKENRLSGISMRLAFSPSETGSWGAEMRERDFDAVRQAGFTHVRIPVRFNNFISGGPGEYILDSAMLCNLDRVIQLVLEREMTAMIEFHYMIPDNKLYFKSGKERSDFEEKFLATWRILAERYINYPDDLWFELANEPHRPVDWNALAARAISVIRQTGENNATRKIVVGVKIPIGRIIHTWDQVNGIDNLELPVTKTDSNIMITFHYYDPYPFTHQGETYTSDLRLISAYWMGNSWSNTIRQTEYVRRDFDKLKHWAEINNTRVILGEFGVSNNVSAGSQVAWTKLVREEAEKRGMIWFFWELFDMGSLGSIYNQENGCWRKEILDALLPEDRMRIYGNNVETVRQLDKLIAGLHNSEWMTRRSAAEGLSMVISGGEMAVPDLAALLYDEEWQVRKFAARALGKYDDVTLPFIPALTELLEDEEWQVRLEAVKALGNLNAASPFVVAALTVRLTDEEWQVRRYAAEALGNEGANAESAVSGLTGLLYDEEWQVRAAALRALSRVAPGDQEARFAVRKCRKDPERIVRNLARTEARKMKNRSR